MCNDYLFYSIFSDVAICSPFTTHHRYKTTLGKEFYNMGSRHFLCTSCLSDQWTLATIASHNVFCYFFCWFVEVDTKLFTHEVYLLLRNYIMKIRLWCLKVSSTYKRIASPWNNKQNSTISSLRNHEAVFCV